MKALSSERRGVPTPIRGSSVHFPKKKVFVEMKRFQTTKLIYISSGSLGDVGVYFALNYLVGAKRLLHASGAFDMYRTLKLKKGGKILL